MAKAEYGIQMYSLRDVTPTSLRDTLKLVSEMGYKYIEFAGFFDNSASDVRAWLDEYGLVASGTHTGLAKLTPDTIDETIRYHKVIGCENLIVPGCDWSTRDLADGVIDALNAAQKKLAENGIRLGYHNHSREFFPNECGIVFEDEVIARTQVELEIDTFWLYNAGVDVIPYLEAHKDRIRVIHVKDGIASAPESKSFDLVNEGVSGRSLGSGNAPVSAVRKWAIANDVLMVVESEGLNPTGPEEVKRCIDYLHSLDAQD